jgi:lipopolysaccharide/colanic/teichoic acid biosynthesis glycosyltransferase
MKRAFDLVLAGLGLVVISPLLLVFAVWVKLDSRGPVFYRGLRAGRFAKPFRIFKLRTMTMDGSDRGAGWTSSDDPRITRAGVTLRRYKLDELPQLINVVKGDMSLVGPRPEVLDEVSRYTDEEKELLTIRPGITDWASIKFSQEGEILRHSQDPVGHYYQSIRPEKVRLALEYVRNNSLLIDVRILVYTLKRVVRIQRSSNIAISQQR